MKQLVTILAVVALSIPSIAAGESFFDDLLKEIQNLAKYQDFTNEQGICISERANWQLCMNGISGPPAGFECTHHMNALQLCLQKHVKEQQDRNQRERLNNSRNEYLNRCNSEHEKFIKAFDNQDAYLCGQILESNKNCLWHRQAAIDLYNATKGPNIPSQAQARPTRHYTCQGHKFECKEKYTKQFYRYWDAAKDLNMDGKCDICGRKIGRGLRSIIRGDFVCR